MATRGIFTVISFDVTHESGGLVLIPVPVNTTLKYPALLNVCEGFRSEEKLLTPLAGSPKFQP